MPETIMSFDTQVGPPDTQTATRMIDATTRQPPSRSVWSRLRQLLLSKWQTQPPQPPGHLRADVGLPPMPVQRRWSEIDRRLHDWR